MLDTGAQSGAGGSGPGPSIYDQWTYDLLHALVPYAYAAQIGQDIVTNPDFGSILPDVGGLGGGGGPSDTFKAKMFLLAEFGGLAAIAAAPVLYRAYKGQKRGKNAKKQAQTDAVAQDLNNASERMLRLLGQFGPYAAIPAAYITVQALEDAQYITRGVGNAVQTMMVGSVGADILKQITNVVL